MAPSPLHGALHSCPVHTCAHHPATPATLLVTLHIPPHNPTCLFTPWLLPSLPAPPTPLNNNTLSTHTLAGTVSFTGSPCLAPHRLPRLAPLASSCAPWEQLGSSWSPVQNPLTRRQPSSSVGTDFTRQGSWPTGLLLSLGLSFFFCHLGWKRRAGRGLLKMTAEVEPHAVGLRGTLACTAQPSPASPVMGCGKARSPDFWAYVDSLTKPLLSGLGHREPKRGRRGERTEGRAASQRTRKDGLFPWAFP